MQSETHKHTLKEQQEDQDNHFLFCYVSWATEKIFLLTSALSD